MTIGIEQMNIKQLLKFFVGQNEYKRNVIIEKLAKLTNSECNTLGVLGYQDFYNFKQDLYDAIKNEIVNGVTDDDFNDEEYNKDSYFYESFLYTYPLKYILKARNISYKDYESSQKLFELILESNPKNSDIVVSTLTELNFSKLQDLKPEYIYTDRDTILRIACRGLLDDRSIKHATDCSLEDLISLVIYSNPVVTEYTVHNDYYLEANASYGVEYLRKYGFYIVLHLRKADYDESMSVSALGSLNIKTNPVKDYVSDINPLPLKAAGYYENDFLEKYGFVTVLTARGVKCSYANTIEELEYLLLNSNPVSNDAYANCIKSLERKNLLLKACLNYYLNSKTIEVDNKIYLKKGISTFSGNSQSIDVVHKSRLAPITAIIHKQEFNGIETGEYWVNMDSNTLSVYNSSDDISTIQWLLFFDNYNYIQYLKDSKYNEDYFRSTFNSVFLKKIQNNEETIYTKQNPATKEVYYVIDLSKYADTNIHNEILFINGVSYPIYDDNFSYDTVTKKLEIYNLKINPTDELVLSCVSRDYYEDKDFETSAYVNPYSSFSEERFAGNKECVKFKHFLNHQPNFVSITPVEYIKDTKVGNIWYTVDDEYIYVYNSGTSTAKFRWFALYDKNAIKDYNFNFKYANPEVLQLERDDLFYDISFNSDPEHNLGDLIYDENEVTKLLTLSNTQELSEEDVIPYTLKVFNAKAFKKSKFLQYTDSFNNNEDGYFDNHPFSKPNGKSYLNYAGQFSSTRLQSFKGNGIVQFVPVLRPEKFKEGEVIAYDPATKSYEKCTKNNAHTVIGVVQNDFSLGLNTYITKTIPIALSGIVDVRVIGVIHSGELISVSDIAGVATTPKKIRFGQIIGKALESYNNNEEIGTIKMLVMNM